MKVYMVECRIEGQTEFQDIYALKEHAQSFCDEQNKKSIYYGRYHVRAVHVRGSDALIAEARSRCWRAGECFPVDAATEQK